jgi:hypothetical protein
MPGNWATASGTITKDAARISAHAARFRQFENVITVFRLSQWVVSGWMSQQASSLPQHLE